MSLRIYFLFFAACLLILGQFILEPNVINSNDLNGNIVPLLHFKESVLTYGNFPQWNPYMNQGLPTVADPLYGIYNPLISLPILIFHYQLAIKVMYFIAVFLSCISMFLLARLYKISVTVSIITAITYAGGSYLSSRILAGHLEKVISFAFLPLFIFCLVKVTKEKNILWSGACAAAVSLILFSGDIYNAFYCLYAIAAVFLYCLFKDKKASFFLGITIALFLMFSSIKILPMIELQNYIYKTKEPFIGGLNPLSFTYNLFLPFEGIFLKFFPIQDFSTGYGWWESLSFIGPFSVLGLFFIFKSALKKHSKEISIIIVLTVLLLLLSMPGSKLNPLYYLILVVDILQYFHVPSRILALWGVVILLSFGIFVDKWKSKKLAVTLLLVNLFIVFVFSQTILMKKDFNRKLAQYDAPIAWIGKNNPYNYYTAHASASGYMPQDKAYLAHLLMLQSNYGLFLKDSPGQAYNFKGNNDYNDIKPGFLLTTTATNSSLLKKVKDYDDNIILYRDLQTLPFARIGNTPQKSFFSVNKITVTSESSGNNVMTLLETNYPGWKVFIDGQRGELLSSRFLQVKTISGKHKYEFVYSSSYFRYGLIISFISLLLWTFYIFNNSYIVRKKRAKKM